MAEQYFASTPSAAHDVQSIRAQVDDLALTFQTDAATFSREHLDEGSALLIRTVPALNGTVVDLGCGWGAVGCFLAKKNPEAVFLLVDVNERAAALAKTNAAANSITNIQVFSGDGIAFLQGQSGLSAVVTNPPIRAGKQVIYAMFEAAHGALLPGGELYIVIRKQQGAESAQRFLQGLFGTAERIARDKGFWILRCKKAS